MRRAFALLACLVALMLGTARAGAPSADLSIDVAGPSSAEVATTVKLKVAIDNHGPGTAEAPKVTVVLPLGVSYARPSEDQPACEHASGQIACSLPRLVAPADNGGQSSQVSFTFPVTSPGSGPRTLDANVVTEAPDPNTANNRARAEIQFWMPQIRLLRATPRRPVAGKRFTATAKLIRSDTRALLRPRVFNCSGEIVFVPKGQGPFVRCKGGIRAGRLWCSWLIPKSARGKLFRGFILSGTHQGGMRPKFFFWRRVL
jgi:hypothetical protein